jgi:hypothetical protein
MHQQAQLRLKKDEVEKLGAAAFVVLPMDLSHAKVFKEENLLLSKGPGPFSKEISLVYATPLCDPAGTAPRCMESREMPPLAGVGGERAIVVRHRQEGILTFAMQPTFATPTSYVEDVDRVLEELKKAAR